MTESEILVENRDFFIPLAFNAPVGGSRRNITIMFGTKKTKMVGYLTVKNFDMFSSFHRIPACDGQTDGWTDILRQHSPHYAYASRSKIYLIQQQRAAKSYNYFN